MKVSGSVRTYIDNNIPDTPSNATHNLHFTVRLPLIMHSSDSARFTGVRNAVLWKIGLKLVDRELVNTKSPCEVATVVACRFQLNEPSTRKRCWTKTHTHDTRIIVGPLKDRGLAVFALLRERQQTAT